MSIGHFDFTIFTPSSLQRKVHTKNATKMKKTTVFANLETLLEKMFARTLIVNSPELKSLRARDARACLMFHEHVEYGRDGKPQRHRAIIGRGAYEHLRAYFVES